MICGDYTKFKFRVHKHNFVVAGPCHLFAWYPPCFCNEEDTSEVTQPQSLNIDYLALTRQSLQSRG